MQPRTNWLRKFSENCYKFLEYSQVIILVLLVIQKNFYSKLIWTSVISSFLFSKKSFGAKFTNFSILFNLTMWHLSAMLPHQNTETAIRIKLVKLDMKNVRLAQPAYFAQSCLAQPAYFAQSCSWSPKFSQYSPFFVRARWGSRGERCPGCRWPATEPRGWRRLRRSLRAA